METRYLIVDGGRLAYDDTGGDGPLVVLVPGLGDLRGEYRFLTGPLRDAGFRVVAMDLRGHGDSSVGWTNYSAEAVGEDILALVDALDAGPAFIVGTSFAAASSVWAAAERPEIVDGLALIGPFVRDHPTSPFMRAAMWALFAGPWRAQSWLMYYDSLYSTTKPSDFATYKAQLAGSLREPGRFDAVKAMMNVSKSGVEARLGDVQAPALVLMGTKDKDFKDPEAEASLVASRLNGTYAMIEGAGHYPHAEMPDATLEALLPFLNSRR